MCALLLADGAPRGAGDLVDAEVPRHESGAVTHTREQSDDGSVVDALLVDLASVGKDVTAVVLAIRAEGGPLGRIPGLRLCALVEGRQPVRLDCGGVTGGRMLVVAECHREEGGGDGWRLRAVTLARPLLPAAPRRPLPAPVVLPPEGTCVGPGLLRIAFDADGGDGAGVDLCALYELADGLKGVVQPLGGAAGALRLPPYVRLDVERDGGGARLTVNLDQAVRFRRVLVYLTLRGTGRSFADVHGTVTVRPDHGPAQDFALDPSGLESTACVLLLLTREGDALRVRREARHLAVRQGVSPQRTVDYAYGWGLVWTPATF
ncbi:Tellurium resistance [Streptomyces sp. NPDC049040]|uniref:Tellurium resistance n=1 Tax=Streptomyces sp. NPDC049040 TaxID=3365593 RepID=UPI003723DEC6